MPLPNPVDTYKNLGVPRYGETEVRLQSTDDGITYTKGSTNDGNFMVFRSNVAEGSTVQTADLLRITSGGGLVGSPNSSAGHWSLSSAGAHVGFKRTVSTVSSGTTLVSPQSTDSGTLYVFVGTVAERTLALPKNPTQGTYFDVLVESSQAASTDIIITSSLDSSADIWAPNLGDGLVSTIPNISPSTESGAFCRLTAISSVRWFLEAPITLESSYSSAVFTTNTFGNRWTSAADVA